MKHRDNKVLGCLLLLVMAFGLLQSFGRSAWAATQVTTLDELKTALNTGGEIQLGADITTTETLRIQINNDAQLDLNGYGILMTSDTGSVILLSSTGNNTFTLSDSNPNSVHYITLDSDGRGTAVNTAPTAEAIEVKGGYLTGSKYLNENYKWENGSGCVYVQGATDFVFVMTGGTILGNIGYAAGGVAIEKGGTFEMRGGTITRNSSSNYAGGVTPSESKFLMKGGTISGNTGPYGGVYFGDGNFEMSGGSITGNNATTNGGGVFVASDNYPYISGLSTITSNFKDATRNTDGTFSGGLANNVYLSDGAQFYVSGNLSPDALFGITMESPGVFTIEMSGKGDASNFISDHHSYIVTLNSDGDAQLEQHEHNLSYELSGDSCIVATCSVANCSLTNHEASLTISAPVTDDGKALLTSDPVGFFEDLSSSVTYQSKNGDA